MITIEQVDKLREKANVSYDEAKTALEASDGDILEALINLEKQGKVTPPEGGGYYNSNTGKSEAKSNFSGSGSKCHESRSQRGTHLKEGLQKIFRFCAMLIHKGNSNTIEVIKDGEVKTSFSITVLVVLAACFFWVTVPALIIGLFFGFRYRFKGPDLGNESVNTAMDTAADAADNLKKTIIEKQQNLNQ